METIKKWEEFETKSNITFPREKVKQYMSNVSNVKKAIEIVGGSERWSKVNDSGFVVYSCLATNEWDGEPTNARYHQLVFKGYDVYMHDSNITHLNHDYDELHSECEKRFKTKMKMAAKAFELVPDLIEESSFPRHKRKEYVCEMQEKLLALTGYYNKVNELPSFKAKEDWNITIHPNYNGSAGRFCVTRGDQFVSVYLDMDKSLGVDDEYWEVYPGSHGDPERVPASDADGLIKTIEGGLTFREVYPEG